MTSMKKIDIHLHLAKEKTPAKDGEMYVSDAEEMLPHLEKQNIRAGILMSSGAAVKGEAFGNNEECRQIAGRYPGIFYWMCNVDLQDAGSVFQRLENYKKQGAVGVGELMVNQSMESPLLQEVFAAAEELQMPVLFHMSPRENFLYGIVDGPGLPLLERNLQRYPKLILIGHSQPFWHEISGDAERMKCGMGNVCPGGRVPELFERYPNLYADLSAYSGSLAIMRDEDFGAAFLEKYQTRLMFGTDMMNTQMLLPLGEWMDKLYEKGRLSREAYENICWKNAGRVFGIK